MSQTSSFGLDRDFLERFNAQGYKPFKTLEEHQAESGSFDKTAEKRDKTAAKNLAHRAGISLERARLEIKRQRNREWMAVKRKATRVNETSHICDPSGEQIQRAAIRAEYTKAKAASGAN